MSRAAPIAAAALAAMLTGCSGGDESGEAGEALEVELKEQNESGITGLATLVPRGGKTNVVVEMTEPFDIEPQPAHIHEGTCDDLSPEPAFALPMLEDGVASADVGISLDELRDGTYAINVHKSAEDADTYVACGEIS